MSTKLQLSISFAANPRTWPLIAGRVNVALIRAHWPEILRIAASIQTGGCELECSAR